jgi:hypothetical protein
LNKSNTYFQIISPENTRIMKKILLTVSLLIAFAGFGFAQTTPAATGTKTKKAKTATTKTTTAPKTAVTGPAKKDGTPDMRYKTNKDAAKAPPVHLKKDGTPDKRYKENKTPTAKTN